MASPVLAFNATPSVGAETTRHASVRGALGKMGAAIGVHEEGTFIQGALGKMTGSAAMTNKNGIRVAGALKAIRGNVNLVNGPRQIAAHGALGKMGGSATIDMEAPLGFAHSYAFNNTGASTVDISVPSGAEGDLLYLFVYRGTTNTNPDTPAGWTELYNGNMTIQSAQVFYKVADGSDGISADLGVIDFNTDSPVLTVDLNGTADAQLLLLRVSGSEDDQDFTAQDNNGNSINCSTTSGGDTRICFYFGGSGSAIDPGGFPSGATVLDYQTMTTSSISLTAKAVGAGAESESYGTTFAARRAGFMAMVDRSGV